MPTANEKKALWFLAFVALSGTGVRLWRANTSHATATETAALDRQIRRVDSVRDARHKSTSRTKQRVAPEPKAPIDLDRATPEQIEALPGIGPALAKRITANRDSAGAFGAIEALCDVRGVGPALVERLRPLVTFTGPRRHVSAACGEPSKKARKPRGAGSRQPR